MSGACVFLNPHKQKQPPQIDTTSNGEYLSSRHSPSSNLTGSLLPELILLFSQRLSGALEDIHYDKLNNLVSFLTCTSIITYSLIYY